MPLMVLYKLGLIVDQLEIRNCSTSFGNFVCQVCSKVCEMVHSMVICKLECFVVHCVSKSELFNCL